MDLHALAPLVTVLVLLEVSAGALVVVVGGDLSGDAGRGFAGTTALILLAIMGVDLLLLALLPDPSALVGHAVDAGGFASMVHWAVALTAGLALYALMCAVGTDPARRVVGLVACGCGALALVRAAGTFSSPLLGGLGGAAAVVPAALLAGSTLAGMLLGHWYLIAPDLSFRPLRRAVGVIFAATALQAAAIAIGLVVAGGGARRQVLTDPVFWLLVVAAGVVATAAVNGLTWYFARIRANQPATAMLYVLIISALMGVVPAHLLYFRTAVPV